ncbi:MAG: hypothetical protein V4690_00585 [Patescibacteria group bacterium]
MPKTDNEWRGLVETANIISKILKKKPRHLKVGYSSTPGGILNAFREGDLTFAQAVKALDKWEKRQKK